MGKAFRILLATICIPSALVWKAAEQWGVAGELAGAYEAFREGWRQAIQRNSRGNQGLAADRDALKAWPVSPEVIRNLGSRSTSSLSWSRAAAAQSPRGGSQGAGRAVLDFVPASILSDYTKPSSGGPALTLQVRQSRTTRNLAESPKKGLEKPQESAGERRA